MEHVILNAQTGETTVVPFTEDEINAKISRDNELAIIGLREKRNKLLQESDWTQVADAPVDRTAWATYRQSLRDLPATAKDIFNPTWPVKPE